MSSTVVLASIASSTSFPGAGATRQGQDSVATLDWKYLGAHSGCLGVSLSGAVYGWMNACMHEEGTNVASCTHIVPALFSLGWLCTLQSIVEESGSSKTETGV